MSAHIKPLLKIALFVAAGITLLVALFFGLLYITEPYSPPKNVLISNITDHQATVSWTTDKATRGEVVVVVEKDKRGKSYLHTFHLVTIGNIEPKKEYQFKIYQGMRKVYEGRLQTGSQLASISMPNPIYGRVVEEDKKLPLWEC